MFSFIKKFFENRRKRAAERDRLCQDLLHRVSKALSDYIGVDKDNKECIQKWRGDNGNLLSELNDIRRFRWSSFYKELKQQNKRFNEFYARSNERIQAIYARERQKQEESRLVSKKLKQLISKQKDQKFKEQYGEIGGAPNLDGLYTVFGEISEGMDVVEKINAMPTGKNGRPNPDVKIIRAYVLEEETAAPQQ